MKRYLVFRYDHYYPCGGWNDFESDYDNVEEALSYAKQLITKEETSPYRNQFGMDFSVEIVDAEEKRIIYESYERRIDNKLIFGIRNYEEIE